MADSFNQFCEKCYISFVSFYSSLGHRSRRTNWSSSSSIPNDYPLQVLLDMTFFLFYSSLWQSTGPCAIHSFAHEFIHLFSCLTNSSGAPARRSGLYQSLNVWESLSPLSSPGLVSLTFTLEWILFRGIPTQGLNDLMNFSFLDFLSHHWDALFPLLQVTPMPLSPKGWSQ